MHLFLERYTDSTKTRIKYEAKTIRLSTNNDISPYNWHSMRIITKLKVINFYFKNNSFELKKKK